MQNSRRRLGAELGIGETAWTPPSPEHYKDVYEWDSYFAALMNAAAAREAIFHDPAESKYWLAAAQNELWAVVDGQEPSGRIPNMKFKSKKFDPEKFLCFKRAATGSNYGQPPLLAHAVLENYLAGMECAEVSSDDSFREEAEQFLEKIYPNARKLYRYWHDHLSNGPDDKKVGIYHPHASGRDSASTFDDRIKPLLLKRKGPDTSQIVDKTNIVIDYASILWHGIRLRRAEAKGDVPKMREVYWINDVMVNCLYADNLYHMEELARISGREDDEVELQNLARAVEQQILDDMWCEEDRRFYALDSDDKFNKSNDMSGLFPIVLPNLREDQLEAILDRMDTSFNTPYPLPSEATDSDEYDPHNQQSDRLWKGGKWVNASKLAEYGLRKQAARSRVDLMHNPTLTERCINWADKIDRRSRFLIKAKGLWEHYDPETGDPLRTRVKNFAWSNWALVHLVKVADHLYRQRGLEPEDQQIAA